jgi:acetolactate synthase-1/2/3 large subunit
MKYSDAFLDLLVGEGYTHCFFVAGGNIMHLLDSARSRFECIPVVHEVAAGIAVEYFNEASPSDGGRAFAMVTAGPGLTNAVTALAGAFLESRELLLIGGQVKSSDLASDGLRQRGIQEVDGMAIAAPVCVATLQIKAPLDPAVVLNAVRAGSTGRKGPVFIEFCLDAQAVPLSSSPSGAEVVAEPMPIAAAEITQAVVDRLLRAERPLVLIGGGLSRATAAKVVPRFSALGVPMATTWNGADRIGDDDPCFFGRPNTWGMRWANLLIQQSDVLLVLGSRLGMQQTGFNWEGFAPLAYVMQCEIDALELAKGHPHVDLPILADANNFAHAVISRLEAGGGPPSAAVDHWSEWRSFGREVRSRLPSMDPANSHELGFVDPFEFVGQLSEHLTAHDVIVPCSSGGAFTTMMQSLRQKLGQIIITDKGLASMGYGLSGAIGASVAHPTRRTILCEGDGGFSQNIQELGTVRSRQPNLKMFVFANDGYASIRMTQRNYFGGTYVGCDSDTGLGFPEWQDLFAAFRIKTCVLDPDMPFNQDVLALLNSAEPAAFVVPIDPEQTYFPKISSRVNESGSMESNPLHLMTPDLSDGDADYCMRYLRKAGSE